MIEAIELALKRGSGRVNVYVLRRPSGEPELWRYSTGLHCPESDLRYADPQPALFSFNSAYGACETCRGFGRVIGVDFGPRDPRPAQDAAQRRDQDDADAGLEGDARTT